MGSSMRTSEAIVGSCRGGSEHDGRGGSFRGALGVFSSHHHERSPSRFYPLPGPQLDRPICRKRYYVY